MKIPRADNLASQSWPKESMNKYSSTNYDT